jgi:hypothetical protein
MRISQKHAKRILDSERDASPRQLQAWARKNKGRLEKELAEAEASLAKGEGRRWDLIEFLAAAEARRARKKRKKR